MRSSTIAPLCGALLGAFACAVHAGEINIVFHPIVEYGEWEAEARGFVTRDSDPAKRGDRVTKLDVAYGVTPWWWTELEFVLDKPPGDTQSLEAIASENIFQLTEQGQYFADFGLFAEYEKVIEENKHEVVLAPIVHRDFGLLQTTANIYFVREFGHAAEGNGIETSWAAQMVWRRNPLIEPGFEYYGDEETHSAGPGIFGRVKLGGNRLKYEFVALLGLNPESPDQTFRWLLEYEFGRPPSR